MKKLILLLFIPLVSFSQEDIERYKVWGRYAYDFELITMVDFRIVLVVFIIDIKNTIFFQFK